MAAEYERRRPLTDIEIERLLYEDDDGEFNENASEIDDAEEQELMEDTNSDSEDDYLHNPVEQISDNDNGNKDNNSPRNFDNNTNGTTSNNDEESFDEEDNIPLAHLANDVRINSNIIVPSKISLKGKNGHCWTSDCKSRCGRKPARNIIHIFQSTQNEATKTDAPINAFFSLFTDSIMEKIVYFTNMEIRMKSVNYKIQKATVAETCIDELKALLGLLVLSAAMKNNHLHTRVMFDSTLCGSIYKSVMSSERFDFLLSCLRFDDKQTRLLRKKTDSFTAIREIWNEFIQNCTKSYKPGSYLTIDEQLLAFRGRCPFRMYIPNKPAKYGIKIVMLCDTTTKYMINAAPYVGKTTNTNGLPLADYYVTELTRSIHGTNRNITMDNWFTSVPLAEKLLKDPYKLTLVGTLRKNKREIPPELLDTKNRKPGTSMFCFDREKTLVSYVPKKNKNVILLSTTHDQPEISMHSLKPQIIEFYNSTKAGVDTFDQMCSNMNCSRKTRRWPLCIFYGMINIATINSYVIYSFNNHKQNNKPLSRREFMMNLHSSLVRPWLEQRKTIPTLSKSIRESIGTSLQNSTNKPATTLTEKGKRTICAFCPSKMRRMTTNHCESCMRAFCGNHRSKKCSEC